jgi:hypothetical protein
MMHSLESKSVVRVDTNEPASPTSTCPIRVEFIRLPLNLNLCRPHLFLQNILLDRFILPLSLPKRKTGLFISGWGPLALEDAPDSFGAYTETASENGCAEGVGIHAMKQSETIHGLSG